MTRNNTPATEARPEAETRTIRAVDDGAFALTTVHGNPQLERPPIVLLPGMFTGRRFWLSDKGVGLAAYLARHGHTTYIVQRRGLSDSSAGDGRPGMVEHIRYDLPVVQAMINQQHAQPAFWGGHSFGGIMAARAGAETLDASRIAGWLLFATQFEIRKHMLDWPGNRMTRGISRLYGRLPAAAAGLGPEDEPHAVIQDATDWVANGRRQPALRNSLGLLHQPVLAISGAGDRVDPGSGCRRFIDHFASDDKTFISAGLDTGYSEDFNHPGIVISKAAQQEIWPLLPPWLDEHSATAPVSAATAPLASGD